ncbi:MAG: hypothetical protein IH840_16505, partial [Candidatus Heimdallarchaeota archaeon]|nr:hypothetical protein [Candidatus Heimdallarchaeota archaeon]
MKIRHFLIIGLLSLSLVYIKAPTAQAENTPDNAIWQFSDNLRPGDFGEWRINYDGQGSLLNTTLDFGNNVTRTLVNSSTFRIEITGDVTSIDLNQNLTESDVDPLFDFYYNGESLPVMNDFTMTLLYPNTFTWPGLDPQNVFYWYRDNAAVFPLTNGTGTIDQDRFYSEGFTDHPEEFRRVSDSAEYDVETGALHWFNHYEENYSNGDFFNVWVNFESGNLMEDRFFRELSFSPELNTGDFFSWEILKLREDNQPISPLTLGEPGEGSIIEISVIKEPELLNLSDPDSDGDAFFALTIDNTMVRLNDTFDGVGDFAQFIFPVIRDFHNGTVHNVLQYLADHPQDLDPGTNIYIQRGRAIFSEDRSDDMFKVNTRIEWDLNTGVMQNLHSSEIYIVNGSQAFELEIRNLEEDRFFEDLSFSPNLNGGD